MLRMLATFVPVAAILTITPGVGTALVVRSAAGGGRRHAFVTTVAHSAGVLAWAVLAAVGIAAVVAASAAAFTVVKLAGAAFLIVVGARTLAGSGDRAPAPRRWQRRTAVRDGLVTSLANPKLAAFFVALFPQFAWMRRAERLTGAVLVGLGVRLALERR